MKRIILIKQTPMIQLGHLYEHIFCMAVSEFLRGHDLFPPLDYSLGGKMYHGGVILIDLELYTDTAIRLSSEIPKINVAFSDDIMSRALGQLVAEIQEPFSSKGYDAIVKSLHELEKQPWQYIDTISLIDTKQLRRQAGPLYITKGSPLPARKLTTSVLLDTKFAASHRELLPLFRQLAWLITASLQEAVANTHGYYSLDDTYTSNSKTIALRNTFNVPNTRDVSVDVTDVAKTCKQTIESLRNAGAFEHFLEELRNVSYEDRHELSPNIERGYEDTLVFVGAKGWQELATEANCHTLLEHISIEVRFGQQKISINL